MALYLFRGRGGRLLLARSWPVLEACQERLLPLGDSLAPTPDILSFRPFARWCKVVPPGRRDLPLLDDTARQEVAMDRRAFLGTLASSVLAGPLAAGGQQGGKAYGRGLLRRG